MKAAPVVIPTTPAPTAPGATSTPTETPHRTPGARTVDYLGFMTAAQWHDHPIPHSSHVRVFRVPVQRADGYQRHMERVIATLDLTDPHRIDELYDIAPFKAPGALRQALADHGFVPLFTVWAALRHIPPTMRTWRYADGERKRVLIEQLRASG